MSDFINLDRLKDEELYKVSSPVIEFLNKWYNPNVNPRLIIDASGNVEVISTINNATIKR